MKIRIGRWLVALFLFGATPLVFAGRSYRVNLYRPQFYGIPHLSALLRIAMRKYTHFIGQDRTQGGTCHGFFHLMIPQQIDIQVSLCRPSGQYA
jgi:hypothetical protein